MNAKKAKELCETKRDPIIKKALDIIFEEVEEAANNGEGYVEVFLPFIDKVPPEYASSLIKKLKTLGYSAYSKRLYHYAISWEEG
jgi:hypothetical protein